MEAQNQAPEASANIQFISAGTALLDKHRLAAQVVRPTPAGCSSGELPASWLTDFSSPPSLLFVIVSKMDCTAEVLVTEYMQVTQTVC